MSLKDFKPEDYVVLILTGLLVFFFVSMAFRVITTGMPLDTEKGKMINHILSSILSIISLFVGFRLRGNKRDE